MLLVAVSAAFATALYQDDFAKLPNGPARLADWQLDGADYTVADGWLVVKSAQSNPSAMLKVAHDGDFTFRATVRNSRSCDWSALLARGVYRLEINNEHVRLGLMHKVGDEWKLVSQAPGYEMYPRNTQVFELRLVAVGNKIAGFIDDRKLVEYTDPDPVPAGGQYGLISGWETDLAWRGVSLTDQADLREWPREQLPQPTGREVVEVTQVRGDPGLTPPPAPFDNVYYDGETAGLRIALKAAKPGITHAALRFRLINVRQQQVAVQSREIDLKPDAETETVARFKAPERGCFKVALDAGLSPDRLGWVEDLGSFTVVPKALYERPFNPNSYFGGHMDGINLAWHLELGRKLGIQWARCHDMMQWTWWDRIQPDGPDQWKWNDEAQGTVDNLHMGTQGEFLWVPKWAWGAQADAPGNHATYPPKNLSDFARYVYNTVLHFKPSIQYWEVWNEPHFNGFYSGTPEQYAEMLAVAYRETKRANPNGIVLGGGGVNPRSFPWVKQMLAACGDHWMDGFTLHYIEPDYGPRVIPELRRMLAAKGVTGPIIDSEETVLSTSFLDQCRADYAEPEARYHFRNACYELVRTYMEALGSGIVRIFYYDQADPWRFKPFPKPRVFQPSQVGGTMWDEGEMLKPIGAAHAALALAIDGKKMQERLSSGPRRVFVFVAPDGASATAVQYAEYPSFAQHTDLRLRLPAGAQAGGLTIMDFMGNERPARVAAGEIVLPLSREPVYVTYRGAGAAEALGAMYKAALMPGSGTLER
jgi:hypothetical protein